MDEPRELALRLDNGTLIRDSGWRCVADVMKSFHGFDPPGHRVYGIIVYADIGEVHPHCLPSTATDGSALLAGGQPTC